MQLLQRLYTYIELTIIANTFLVMSYDLTYIDMCVIVFIYFVFHVVCYD